MIALFPLYKMMARGLTTYKTVLYVTLCTVPHLFSLIFFNGQRQIQSEVQIHAPYVHVHCDPTPSSP